MAERKPISKSLRFEILKRDDFTCQYCGAKPPAVILHVDHKRSVAADGSNDPENLITACAPCNLGKGARPLDKPPRPAPATNKRHRLTADQRERLEQEFNMVASVISGEFAVIPSKKRTICRFIENLGVEKVIAAAEIARAKFGWKESRFPYFCGICWRQIRDVEKGADR